MTSPGAMELSKVTDRDLQDEQPAFFCWTTTDAPGEKAEEEIAPNLASMIGITKRATRRAKSRPICTDLKIGLLLPLK